MKLAKIVLGEAANINPRLVERPDADAPVSFLGMADIDAARGSTSLGAERPFGEVSKGYTQFSDRDLLVAKITPCFENGKIAQAVLGNPHGAGSTEFHVIRPDRTRFDDRFLLHFLRQPYIRVAGELRMTGSGGQRRVPEAYLAGLEVPLVDLAEQRRIAQVLDDVDALRVKRVNAISLLDTLAQSVFLEMFGDPVTNPRRFPQVQLTDLGTLDRGVSKHRPRNDPRLLGGSYPLIQTGDVAGAHGYIRSFASTYSDMGLAQSRLWPAGTLCITIAANIAKTGILQFDACFPDSVVGFTSDSATVEYVQTWLSFLQANLERMAPESAQKNINLATLRSLVIPNPGCELIDEFATRIKAAVRLRTAAVSHLAELDSLFSSLRHQAFSGSLLQDSRVPAS